ncbi:MAG TPA: hypothetical protein VGM81_10525 [Burkholderiaceae bacterium]|jgi:hypothetical protein
MSAVTFRAVSPLRASWHSLTNPWGWGSWSLVALLMLGMPLLLWVLQGPMGGLVMLGAMLGIALMAMWGQLVTNTLHQNHPTLARLLPSQPRRLRLNLVLVFLALSCAASLLSTSIHIAHFGVWICAGLIFVAAGMRWPLLWASTSIFGFAPLLPHYLPAALQGVPTQLLDLLGTPLGFACLLTAGAVFLSSLIRDGGDGHQALYDRLQKRRRQFKSSVDGELMQGGWFCNVAMGGYRRSFNKALARAEAGRAGFERAMLALGPQAHFSAISMGITVLAVIMVLVIGLMALGGVFGQGKQVGGGIANSMFGLLGTLMGGVTQLHASIIKRRHEQAIVSLLPGVPRGQAFNRQFGIALMRRYLMLWGCGSLIMTVLLGFIPGTGYAVLAFVVTLLGGGLVLLRDWSNGGLLKGWMAILVYAPLSITAMAARLAMERDVLSVPAFLALAALILGLLYAWRWRVLTRSRMAWPVGRS